MFRQFRFVTVSAATLSAGALLMAGTVGVRAQTPVSDELAITGTATITADGVGTPSAQQAALGLTCADPVAPGQVGDPVPSVDLLGGCGNFNFAGTAVGTSDGDNVGDVPEAGTATISATGAFHNIVCGTGDASGTATVTAGIDAGETGPFSITFVGGQGTLTGSLRDPADGSVDNLTGTVTLGAQTPGDDALDCVSQFTITATVTATESTGP